MEPPTCFPDHLCPGFRLLGETAECYQLTDHQVTVRAADDARTFLTHGWQVLHPFNECPLRKLEQRISLDQGSSAWERLGQDIGGVDVRLPRR